MLIISVLICFLFFLLLFLNFVNLFLNFVNLFLDFSREFFMFVKAAEAHGRDAFESIALEMGTKTEKVNCLISVFFCVILIGFLLFVCRRFVISRKCFGNNTSVSMATSVT